MRKFTLLCVTFFVFALNAVAQPYMYGYKFEIHIKEKDLKGSGSLANFTMRLNDDKDDLKKQYVDNKGKTKGFVLTDFGTDLYITDEDNNPIDYWIEYYDASEGEYTLFLNIPVLDLEDDMWLNAYCGYANGTTTLSSAAAFGPNCVERWPMDGSSLSSTVSTNSISSNNLTQNNPLYVPFSKDEDDIVDGMKEFDGSNDFVETDSDVILDGDFTISIYGTFPKPSTNNEVGIIGSDAATLNNQSLFWGFKNEKMFFGFNDGNNLQTFQSGHKPNTSKAEWIHLVREGNKLKLYIKKSLKDTWNMPYPQPSSLYFNKIGNIINASSMHLREVRVYDVALSEDYIENIYQVYKKDIAHFHEGDEQVQYITENDGSYDFSNTWENNNDPGTISDATIFVRDSLFLEDIDAEVGNVVLESNGVIVVDSNSELIINGAFYNEGGLIVRNGGSFIQVADGDILGNGLCTYIRNTQYINSYHFYQYWASPLKSATMGDVFVGANSNFFYSYNAAAQGWQAEDNNTVMLPGHGYITRPSVGLNMNDEDRFFQGTFNNGDITIHVDTGGVNSQNLIGNPYPSSVDLVKFFDDNPILDQTAYFWNHTGHTVINGLYSSADYATWTPLGPAAGTGGELPEGYLPTGQSVFICALAPGDVTFKNSHRASLHNDIFFKKDYDADFQRTWISAVDLADSVRCQALIGFADYAEYGYDQTDGRMASTSGFKFGSILDGTKYSVQGWPSMAMGEVSKVPVFISTNDDKVFQIRIDSTTNISDQFEVIFHDKQTGYKYNLLDENCYISVVAGDHTNRFEIIFKYNLEEIISDNLPNHSDMETPDVTTGLKEVIVKGNDRDYQISVYNLNGQSVYKGALSTLETKRLGLPSGAYVISFVDNQQNVSTRKIIVM